MPTWNPQQLKAITTKHKNILVSASAGSGKTTVLIARLIDLVIRDRIPISAILAMTFTEAAASEMKKRLAYELHALLKDCRDSAEKAYITRQLSDIQNAHISTIHSFCLSILQEHYYTIGLTRERVNNILDTSSMTLYQQQALKQAIQKQYEKKDAAFLELCIRFSARPENDDQLLRMVQTLAETASSKPNPEKWLDDCEQLYQEYRQLNDLPSYILSMFYDYLRTQYEIYKELLIRIKERLQHLYPDETKKLEVLIKKITALDACEAAIQEQRYAVFRQAFIAVCHGIVPTAPDKDDTQYNKLRKQTQQLEDALLEILFDEEKYLKDLSSLRPSVSKLIEICRDYRSIYRTIKEEEQGIDFDDMEHYALEILQVNQNAAAKRYQLLFEEIMVDEFQDSNDVQNTLVNLISRDNNVFRVGDIKQSIYGFRHAKPALMRGLIEQRGEQDEVIYLSNNYRSKKMIVDFNNFLFERLMNTDGFDCTYQPQDNVETGIPAQLEKNVPVVFHAIDHNAINEQEQTIWSKNDFKASYIASKIIEIKDKEQRSWKDFVVLVRGNARKNDMKAAFDTLHIPYFIDIKDGFYQSNAVQIVVSFLKFCLSPHEDISFLAILLSPLTELTTEAITDARLQMEKGQSFYDYYRTHPFKSFPALIELKQQLHQKSLSEMLNAIYDYRDFYAFYTTMQEKTNLDLLFEKALRFEEEQVGSVSAFLKLIDHIKDAQTAEAIPVGSEEDVVRVMSIHQSKGLQFPVVFLWSNTSQIPIEFKDLCICDSDLGIAMKQLELPNRYVRTTPIRIAMEHKKNKEELEEEMRILYVATTRAQQQMHIVDCIKAMEDYEKPCTMSSIYERGGYTSWILQSFYEQHSPLFKIERISRMWEQIVQDSEEESCHVQILRYEEPTQATTFLTASSSKETAELPELTLYDDALQHGTEIHEIIEKVEYPYHRDQVLHYAQQQGITVQEQDLEHLRKLAADPLYQKTQLMEHVHELPFMVQDAHTILHGYIDYFALSNTDVYIIDFKTDYITDTQKLKELYSSQLKTYEKAIRLLYPNHNIHTFLYSITMDTCIDIT